MNAETFHRDLLGRDPDKTPKTYWLTPRHRELYTGFESGITGFDGSSRSQEDFLATLVLALFQTNGPDGFRQVLLITPKSKQKWVTAQIKKVAHHVFRCRRGELDAVKVLRQAFQHLSLCERPNQAPKGVGWVFFGFSSARLPLWAKGQLLD